MKDVYGHYLILKFTTQLHQLLTEELKAASGHAEQVTFNNREQLPAMIKLLDDIHKLPLLSSSEYMVAVAQQELVTARANLAAEGDSPSEEAEGAVKEKTEALAAVEAEAASTKESHSKTGTKEPLNWEAYSAGIESLVKKAQEDIATKRTKAQATAKATVLNAEQTTNYANNMLRIYRVVRKVLDTETFLNHRDENASRYQAASVSTGLPQLIDIALDYLLSRQVKKVASGKTSLSDITMDKWRALKEAIQAWHEVMGSTLKCKPLLCKGILRDLVAKETEIQTKAPASESSNAVKRAGSAVMSFMWKSTTAVKEAVTGEETLGTKLATLLSRYCQTVSEAAVPSNVDDVLSSLTPPSHLGGGGGGGGPTTV